MKLAIKVKPGSRANRVSFEGENIVIRVKAPAHEGRANEELVRFLAGILGIPGSQVVITGGHLSRFKRLELPEDAVAKLKKLAAGS